MSLLFSWVWLFVIFSADDCITAVCMSIYTAVTCLMLLFHLFELNWVWLFSHFTFLHDRILVLALAIYDSWWIWSVSGKARKCTVYLCELICPYQPSRSLRSSVQLLLTLRHASLTISHALSVTHLLASEIPSHYPSERPNPSVHSSAA